MIAIHPTRFHLPTETLRFLTAAPAPVDASRGWPCHTEHCSDGLPCDGSRGMCP